jgi:hypothetical protein
LRDNKFVPDEIPTPPPLAPEDYYFENGLIVFTAAYHLKRGYCCGSGCRHCPYRDADSGAENAAAGPGRGES